MPNFIMLQSVFTQAAALGILIPDELKKLPGLLDEFISIADGLITSADGTGCCDELTVVDAAKVTELSQVVSSLRDDISTPNLPSIGVSLSIFDCHGEPYASRVVNLAAAGVSDVVDHAAQAVLLHRAGKNMGSVMDELESALVVYDVIPEEGDWPLSGCTANVSIGLESIDIETGPVYGGATASSGKNALVDRSMLRGAPVHHISVAYPGGGKLGIPPEATQDGAERLIRELGLVPLNLVVETQELGTDCVADVRLTVSLPGSAVLIGEISDVVKYAAEHWDLRFRSLHPAEQSELVDRMVRTVGANR
ncbi:hypothetical protein KW849_14655 [Pseudomonas sp. PDM26]|uniref:hypothetical protein n=1 Tax=Pseudomonas TaxID=286 RepID=UPI001C472D5E|nr:MULTISPECIES: hypothetical protein [Pseudomonas]MBV7547530.1 hypothetical protein [Pseudomonas sp. PDM26]MCT9827466.1 hypothetical protein [Pseudomonas veronii]